MLKNQNDRELIKAVHDDELVDFLKGINMYQSIQEGKCTCKYCAKVITIQNMTAVFPESGVIKFVCDDLQCIMKFRNHLQKNS